MVSFSVVICCYTEARWNQVLSAIASARHQSLPALEVIVAVDHNPGLEERLRQTVDARVVPNRYERGLSGARNSGIEVASGEVVAFLDDDAEAEPTWLAEMARWYEDPAVLGVGGRVMPVWGEAGRPPGFPREFDWVVGCTYEGMPDAPATIRNPIGANMSIRRSVFERVGGFRPAVGRIGRLPLGCEETELSIRAAQRLGGRFVYVPTAVVWHHVGDSRRGWAYFVRRCYSEGRSKGIVTELVGSRDGLASERAHLRRVLLSAFARDLRQAVLARDADAAGRALRNAGGTLAAGAGYAVQRLAGARRAVLEPAPALAIHEEAA